MKRIICLVLALVLVASVVACGNNQEGNSATEGDTISNTSDEENSMQVELEEQELVEYNIYIDHSWFWFDKWGEDSISQQVTLETGVTFNVTRASDEQQLALLIAAGDLPDIIYTSTESTMALLEDPDVCYSYNELIEATGVDIYATDAEISNNTAEDGNFYALRNAYTSQEAIDEGDTLLSPGIKSIAYRTDIYEAIGSPELNTLEDLENALVLAKEMYPDIIPLLNDKDYLWYFAEQLGVVGNDSEVGYDEEGNPSYSLNNAGIQEYYSFVNNLARKGLISSEAQTYNYDKYCEIRNSGKCFMLLRASDEAITANNAAIEADSGYTWQLLDHELSEDALVYANTGIGWSGTYISKNCSNPEKAIEFISWCRSEEGRKLTSWGIEGEHWVYNTEGKTETTESYRDAIASGKQKQDDFGIGVWIFGDQGDENSFIDNAVTDPAQVDNINRLKSAVQHTRVMSELYCTIPKAGDELNIFNSLHDMRNSEILKVFFADSDEAYQTALDNMYSQAEKIGINQLESWMEVQLVEQANK